MALHPDGITVATGQVGTRPAVRIWHSLSLATVSILQGVHAHGIAAIAFGGSKSHLVTL